MSHLWRLVKKETRELLRPRYLLPLLFVPVMFVALGQGFGGLEEQLAEQPEIAVIDRDGGEHARVVAETLSKNAEVVEVPEGASLDRAIRAVREDDGDAVVVIPDGFSAAILSGRQGTVEVHAVVDTVSMFGAASSAKVQGIVAGAGEQITMDVTGATPNQLYPVTTSSRTVLKGQRIDASPGALSTSFTQQFLFVPIVIMMVILVSGQMVMNSMGIEKENKTLETLLTMPVKRRTIVVAKLLGSASIGLVGAGIYTGALAYYQSSLSFGGGGANLSLGGLDYFVIGVSVFLSLVGVLALALCLGIFAGDRQGAQMLLLPISVLAIVPMFVTMFTEVSALGLPLQVVLYAIPFTHPIIAPKQLLFGGTTLVFAGIVYEVIFATAMIALAVHLFNSDRLVTGSAGRVGKYLKMIQR